MERFSRTELLLGAAGINKLHESCVAVFGIGGVGSYVVEGLARSGVGHLVLIDADTVSVSNINRQLPALTSTVGRVKAEVMAERVRDINPDIKVDIIKDFYLPESADRFFIADYDYIVDAVDTVAAKIDLAVQAQERNIPIIASMGAGNKLDPTRFEVADIYKTSVCPLARALRHKLKKAGVRKLKVVYSREEPVHRTTESDNGHPTPGSVAFVPSVAGLIIAGEVVKDLIE